MKPADLHKVWSAPDNTRLTSKQYSFRLPVHVAAKLQALADVFPNKTKTEMVGDLLAAALDDLIASLPHEVGKAIGRDEDGDEYYEEIGLRPRVWELANKHFKQLERDLGNREPSDIWQVAPKSEARKE